MKIYIHRAVYERARAVAHAQGRTKSALVQDALIRLLGLEGMTLPDEVIYGKENKKWNTS